MSNTELRNFPSASPTMIGTPPTLFASHFLHWILDLGMKNH